MHDQELIANVADAHARGFQKLMNPNTWVCTHCDFCGQESSVVVAHELNCVHTKAQNRDPSATLSAEPTSNIHGHCKCYEQPCWDSNGDRVPTGGFDSATLQYNYDNAEWQERGGWLQLAKPIE